MTITQALVGITKCNAANWHFPLRSSTDARRPILVPPYSTTFIYLHTPSIGGWCSYVRLG